MTTQNRFKKFEAHLKANGLTSLLARSQKEKSATGIVTLLEEDLLAEKRHGSDEAATVLFQAVVLLNEGAFGASVCAATQTAWFAKKMLEQHGDLFSRQRLTLVGGRMENAFQTKLVAAFRQAIANAWLVTPHAADARAFLDLLFATFDGDDVNGDVEGLAKPLRTALAKEWCRMARVLEGVAQLDRMQFPQNEIRTVLAIGAVRLSPRVLVSLVAASAPLFAKGEGGPDNYVVAEIGTSIQLIAAKHLA